MRLRVLERGHRPLVRLQLRVIRAVVGDVPGPTLLCSYRRGLFGGPFAAYTQRVMRGPSSWSVGERELFAAFVSRCNRCAY
jgi:hypothetical protein